MPENKITYGLEKVHIAFKGTSQTESIQVTAPCTTDGEITVTVTATTLLGGSSPLAIKVALAAESHATVAQVASAIVTTLNDNTTFAAIFRAYRVGDTITIQTKVAQANDATLAIAVTPGTTGVTVGASTNGTNGTTSWGTPIEIPGAVSLKPKAEGQSSTFYADNTNYFSVTANNGYTADLELALLPEVVKAEMLGWTFDTNGMLVELADAMPKEFALMGQILGDQKNRRFVYWSTTAARPEKEEKTKGESIEPNTDVLKLTMAPIEINGKRMCRGVMELSDTNQAVYDAFFNSVYVPVGV